MNPINVELYRKLLTEARYYGATERIMFFEYWLRVAAECRKDRSRKETGPCTNE